MASADKVTLLDQLQDTATRIKQYILQQISDLAEAVQAAIPDTYAGSPTAGGVANKAASIPMGHLDSTSTKTVMTAQVDGITELRDGVCMWLKNGVVASASGFTLNINGLGAKPVYSSLAAATRSTTIFAVAYTMLFIYNETRVTGGCWDIVYGYDSDANTVPTGYCTTAAATAAKTVTCTYGYRGDTNYFPCCFRYKNSAANATLAISSYATDAAPIYVNGARTTAANTFGPGVVLFLYHDGAYYCYNDGRFPILVDGVVTSVQEYVAAGSVSMTDEEVDQAVDAAFTHTITNNSPTLVSVQDSSVAYDEVIAMNIAGGELHVIVGTTAGGYDIMNGYFNTSQTISFVMPNAPAFVSATIEGGGSND